jgi:hypothetical protein
MSVSKLLQKEKDGTFFKGAAEEKTASIYTKETMRARLISLYERRGEPIPLDLLAEKTAAFGDTEPLWQDPNVGKIDYESKVPVKLNPKPPVTRGEGSGDAPSDNARNVGINVGQLGTQLAGNVVPEMGTTDKVSAVIDELYKLGAITDSEALETINRLDTMDKNKLKADQVGRYAAIGAIAGPAISALRGRIQGKKKHYFKDAEGISGHVRQVVGDAVAGAATSGAIPLVRSALDRKAASDKLHEYAKEKTAGFLNAVKHLPHAPLHSSGWEHATDVAGVGAMMAGSASHLMGQAQARPGEDDNAHSPIGAAGQSAMDLGGLTAMALPTIAALNQMRKGRLGVHGGNAGNGQRGVNIANMAGLGALAVPTADKVQAHLRAAPGEDAHSKMLLGDTAHRALELGGYGALMGATVANKDNSNLDKGLILGGYGALAAPQVVPFKSAGRTVSELGGLAALAAPAIMSMRHH